jgi:hypothetical protein
VRDFALSVPVGSVFEVVSGARCAIVLRWLHFFSLQLCLTIVQVRSALLLLFSAARTQLPLAVQLQFAQPLRRLLFV